MSDLDPSEEYCRKKSLLKENDVPIQQEIRCRLGDDLTEVLFETCMPSLKPYLGLTPTLNGPGDDLWVSPSDILIGKIRLKPPLTNKYIKALTHQGILDIGSVIEKKFENEQNLITQKAIAENEELIKFMAEKEKQKAVAVARDEEQAKCELVMEDLKLDFSLTLEKELELLEQKLEKKKHQAVDKAKREVETIMQRRMELAVLETVQRLIEQFAGELLKQSKKLHQHFWFHIKEEKLKLKQAVRKEKLRSKQQLQKLRAELECENIANLMYLLATERRRCSCEVKQIKTSYKARLAELNAELVSRSEEIEKLTLENEENTRKILTREQFLYEIIKQFQKFIYFVLRAVPTQAEYLLNVEKLMIFELTKTLLDTQPELFDKDNPLNVIKSSATVSSQSSREMGLVAPDYHNCENVVETVDSVHTLTSNEDLPVFVFNDKTYIREDFRNMISQGLQISKDNRLWTRDIEYLADSLQPDITSIISNSSLTSSSQSKPLKSDASSHFVPSNVKLSMKVPEKDSQTPVAVAESHSNRFSQVRDSICVTAQRLDALKHKSTRKSYRDKYHCHYAPNLDKTNVPCFKLSGVDTSKFDTHVDSLILLAKKSPSWRIPSVRSVLEKRRTSKLEMAVDSLTLLRSKETIRIKSKESELGSTNSDGTNSDDQLKTVKMSHFEVIPGKKRSSVVSFHFMPKIIPNDDEFEDVEVPAKKKLASELINKPNQASVVGDRLGIEHLQNQDEFTIKRVNSFITIFRKHPSLRKLFTEVSRK
ncbi:hypothetical protein CBL_10233 [Carabus blaptoides fortunei]